MLWEKRGGTEGGVVAFFTSYIFSTLRIFFPGASSRFLIKISIVKVSFKLVNIDKSFKSFFFHGRKQSMKFYFSFLNVISILVSVSAVTNGYVSTKKKKSAVLDKKKKNVLSK